MGRKKYKLVSNIKKSIVIGNYREFLATDTAGLVAVSHVLDLAEDLESIVHCGDHAVQTVSDEFYLGVESSVGGQIANGD